MFLSNILSLSCNSFVMFWAMMELSMLSFLGLLVTNFSKANKGESFMYLVIQGSASSLFLVTFLMAPAFAPAIKLLLLSLSLFIKLGAAPFHLWYLWMIENMSWDMFWYLSSIQKLLPIVFLSMMFNQTIILWAVISALTGAMGGVMNLKTTFMLGYSSILNLSWMLTLTSNLYLVLAFFFIYTFNLFILSFVLLENNWSNFLMFYMKSWSPAQMMNFFFPLISLMGIPPTIGFLAKFISITHIFHLSPTIMIILLTSSGVMLWMYTSIMFQGWKQTSISNTYKISSWNFPWFLLTMSPVIMTF